MGQEPASRGQRLALIAGVVLGAIIGALIARFFASRAAEGEIAEAPDTGSDAIVLRERPGSAASVEDAPIALPLASEANAALAAPAEDAAEEDAFPASEAEPDVIPAPPVARGPVRIAPVEGRCPASHPIKGNHNSQGEFIYHVPGGQLYSHTHPEACFATVADAEAAGFRSSKR